MAIFNSSDFLMENYWKADNAKYNFEIGEFTYPYIEGQDIKMVPKEEYKSYVLIREKLENLAYE